MTIFGILIQLNNFEAFDRRTYNINYNGYYWFINFLQALMNWMFGVFVEPFPKIFSNESINLVRFRSAD